MQQITQYIYQKLTGYPFKFLSSRMFSALGIVALHVLIHQIRGQQFEIKDQQYFMSTQNNNSQYVPRYQKSENYDKILQYLFPDDLSVSIRDKLVRGRLRVTGQQNYFRNQFNKSGLYIGSPYYFIYQRKGPGLFGKKQYVEIQANIQNDTNIHQQSGQTDDSRVEVWLILLLFWALISLFMTFVLLPSISLLSSKRGLKNKYEPIVSKHSINRTISNSQEYLEHKKQKSLDKLYCNQERGHNMIYQRSDEDKKQNEPRVSQLVKYFSSFCQIAFLYSIFLVVYQCYSFVLRTFLYAVEGQLKLLLCCTLISLIMILVLLPSISVSSSKRGLKNKYEKIVSKHSIYRIISNSQEYLEHKKKQKSLDKLYCNQERGHNMIYQRSDDKIKDFQAQKKLVQSNKQCFQQRHPLGSETKQLNSQLFESVRTSYKQNFLSQIQQISQIQQKTCTEALFLIEQIPQLKFFSLKQQYSILKMKTQGLSELGRFGEAFKSITQSLQVFGQYSLANNIQMRYVHIDLLQTQIKMARRLEGYENYIKKIEEIIQQDLVAIENQSIRLEQKDKDTDS